MNSLTWYIELTSRDSSLVHKPLPADDPVQRQPDITLAKSLLGWEPTHSNLEDGLQRTIAWLQ